MISSHPHFNKIFLGEAGYWLRYNYLGMEDAVKVITNNREYYVGASVINNLDELKTLTSSTHGYILYDYMAQLEVQMQLLHFLQQVNLTTSKSIDLTSNDDIS